MAGEGLLTWKSLGETSRQAFVSAYLSRRFATFKELCEHFGVEYHSAHKALERNGALEQRRALDNQEEQQREHQADRTARSIYGQLQLGGSILDLTWARLRAMLLSDEKLSRDDLLAISERVSVDMARVAGALHKTTEAQALHAERIASLTGAKTEDSGNQVGNQSLHPQILEALRYSAIAYIRGQQQAELQQRQANHHPQPHVIDQQQHPTAEASQQQGQQQSPDQGPPAFHGPAV